MKISYLILEVIICLVLISCTKSVNDSIILKEFPRNEETNYSLGWFPQNPINIEELNSEYDDYNSFLPVIGSRIELYYSTNKNSNGEVFNISSRCIDAFFNYEDSVFNFNVTNDYPHYSYQLLPRINTTYNEVGPFSLENLNDLWIFLYANDSLEQFDIQFAYTYKSDWGHSDSQRKIFGPFSGNVFNSSFDDFYPTIDKENSMFYFSSNRDYNYDIYEINISDSNIVEWLENGSDFPVICQNLSSSYDDKCPYINDNLLVFSSNCKSGYGGYDLWYSLYENGEWSAPHNFGSRINTEFDEYRPAIAFFRDSNNDLMIFSSNRPGGKGGFDLYYVGISKMINTN